MVSARDCGLIPKRSFVLLCAHAGNRDHFIWPLLSLISANVATCNLSPMRWIGCGSF
jgi:hypothetical protein